MRVVLLLVVVAVLIAVLLPLLRRPAVASRRPPALDDELVKDPVRQTYVVRSRAVTGRDTAGAPYFCSTDCARRYSG